MYKTLMKLKKQVKTNGSENTQTLTPQNVKMGNTSAARVGMSPGKSVELRMKNLQQLRYVQELYEEKILSEPEFIEQKQMILDSLRKLT